MMRPSTQIILAIALIAVPYVAGHVETSDLEESINLKLDRLSFFKRKPGSSSRNKSKNAPVPFGTTNKKIIETANESAKRQFESIRANLASMKNKLRNMTANKDRIIQKNANRIGAGGDALYSYDGGPGTSNWDGACASGRAQSPIDFKPEETFSVYRRVLKFSGVQQIPLSTNISNSGHSVKVRLRTAKPITVTGGVFGDRVYEFQQMHFHWGKNMDQGSEHTVKAKRFPLEGHLVFYKANVKNPTNEPDGIAVLGVQYEVSKKDNLILEPVVKALGLITHPGQFVVKQNGFALREYLPTNLDSYFNYGGSLTTPPCTEGVTWLVFTERAPISDRQVSQFRTVKDELGWKIDYNYRETQPHNSRKVFLVKSSERIVS